MNKYLVDSFALLEFLEGTQGAKYVSALFKESLNEKAAVFISELTLSFIESIIIRNFSDAKLELFRKTMEKLPATIIELDKNTFTKAFIYGNEYNLKPETAYCLVVSEDNDFTLVTSNKKLKKISKNFKIKII